MQRKSMGIALAAVFVALTAVFGALPFVFLVPVLLASVTTDFKTSLIVSAFFGVISLVYSLMGGSIVAVAFVANPWIPIVARVLIGPAARGVFLLIDGAIKREGKLKAVLPVAAAGAVGSLLNTGLVVMLLLLCASDVSVGGKTLFVSVPMMLGSGAIELAVNMICLPPLAMAVNKIRRRRTA